MCAPRTPSTALSSVKVESLGRRQPSAAVSEACCCTCALQSPLQPYTSLHPTTAHIGEGSSTRNSDDLDAVLRAQEHAQGCPAAGTDTGHLLAAAPPAAAVLCGRRRAGAARELLLRHADGSVDAVPPDAPSLTLCCCCCHPQEPPGVKLSDQLLKRYLSNAELVRVERRSAAAATAHTPAPSTATLAHPCVLHLCA
jgi:hypothetical protein